MKTQPSLLAPLAALLLVTGASTLWAQSNGATALEGSWTLEVHQQNPPPGVSDFRSLITFSAGGATVEASGAPGTGPATGAWQFVRAGEFAVTWLKPIYNVQSGALLGTLKIRGRIRMKSPDEYEGADKLDFFLPDGTLAVSWSSTTRGRRIKVEPID